mmetsp:Transcript_42059/g.105786  ORF Transcript_42059/g.105786 Transcript_42059/m.105786 type:complete len:213 (+) Transcript_42059:391-1029(+)
MSSIRALAISASKADQLTHPLRLLAQCPKPGHHPATGRVSTTPLLEHLVQLGQLFWTRAQVHHSGLMLSQHREEVLERVRRCKGHRGYHPLRHRRGPCQHQLHRTSQRHSKWERDTSQNHVSLVSTAKALREQRSSLLVARQYRRSQVCLHSRRCRRCRRHRHRRRQHSRRHQHQQVRFLDVGPCHALRVLTRKGHATPLAGKQGRRSRDSC